MGLCRIIPKKEKEKMANVKEILPVAREEAVTTNGGAGERRRVAGYARVSTDKDEQFGSYESQIAYYTRYIESRSDWELVGVYTDEGITGTSTKKRSGFNRMVQDALDGRIDLIVTKSVSRFARNTVDSLVTIRKLKDVGCECFFEKENIYTFDGKGELLITIMSSLAQEESRSISANVSWGMKESMRRGNAYVPYSSFLGYDKGENGEMKINPLEAVTVIRIYGLYLQDYNPYQISKLLEEEGIPSPTGRRRWFTSTVESILKNEKYRGDALRQKTYTKDFLSKEKVVNSGEVPQYYITDHHEAIISAKVFEEVQEKLKAGKSRGTIKRCENPFSYRVRCGHCGALYGPKTWHIHTTSEKTIWMCNGKYKRDEICTSPILCEDDLRRFSIAGIRGLLADTARADAVFEAIREKEAYSRGYEAECDCFEAEIKRVGRLISENELRNVERAEEYRKRLLIAEEGLVRARKKTAECMQRGEDAAVFFNALKEIGEITKFDREVWDRVVMQLTVYSEDDVKIVFADGSEMSVIL